ncbi:hypothetical protein DFH27DRAFT_362770 [Peziza echinospora]|nr:hypothetical protein DFH27DRAFT_362770 [Peziza echinospora]
MPKKFKHKDNFIKQWSKPQGTVPQTLSGSNSAQNNNNNSSNSANSVNELLNHLRVSQPSAEHEVRNASPSQVAQVATQRSLPPSVSALLGNAPPLPLAPRTRQAPRYFRRGISGPPPPRSWLNNADAQAAAVEREEKVQAARRRDCAKDLDLRHILPGLPTVGGERSLRHYALLAMARNWSWLSKYEQHYIPEMRPGLKALLIAYVALYGDVPIDRAALEIMYPLKKKMGEKKAIGGGGAGTIKDGKAGSGTQGNVNNKSYTSDDSGDGNQGNEPLKSPATPTTPISWEDEAQDDDSPGGGLSSFVDADDDEDETTHLPLCHALHPTHLSPSSLLHFLFPHNSGRSKGSPPARFPNLTYLSLSHPSSDIPASTLWTQFLLHLVPKLPNALSHLSLSNWPAPPEPLSTYNPFPAIARNLYCLKCIDLSNWPDHLILEGLVAPGIWKYWRGLKKIIWREAWGVTMPVLVVAGDEEGYRARVREWRLKRARVIQQRVLEERKSCGVHGWVDVAIE